MTKKLLPILTGIVLIIGLVTILYAKHYPIKNECYNAIQAQNRSYSADKLADTETFDKYKVPVYTGKLSDLNLKASSPEAKMFRTWINVKIGAEGINFAGHYSLVYVGMTGWGNNYFLVDRITGKGVPVPFLIGYIKTQPDSTLLLINPKDLVYSDNYESEFACEHSVTGNFTESDADLRPYYYNWKVSEFVQLGNPATVNPFWEEYFK